MEHKYHIRHIETGLWWKAKGQGLTDKRRQAEKMTKAWATSQVESAPKLIEMVQT